MRVEATTRVLRVEAAILAMSRVNATTLMRKVKLTTLILMRVKAKKQQKNNGLGRSQLVKEKSVMNGRTF